MYELQVWNPTTETWMRTGVTDYTGAAQQYIDGDPDNRRVMESDTRKIVMQPDG